MVLVPFAAGKMHTTENCIVESAAHQGTTSDTVDIYWRKGKGKGKNKGNGKGKRSFPSPKGKGKGTGKSQMQGPRRNLFEEVDISGFGTSSRTTAKAPDPLAAAAATGSGSMAGEDTTSSGLQLLGVSDNSQQNNVRRRLSLFDFIEDVPTSNITFAVNKPLSSKDS